MEEEGYSVPLLLNAHTFISLGVGLTVDHLSKPAATLAACVGSAKREERLPWVGERAQRPHPSVTAAVCLGTSSSSSS